MKNIDKYQESAKVKTMVVSKFKQVPRINLVLDKQKLLPVGILFMLGSWIGLSMACDNLLLDKALICSTIIVSVLFLKTIEENEKKNNNL